MVADECPALRFDPPAGERRPGIPKFIRVDMGVNWLLGVNGPLVDTFGFKYGHGGYPKKRPPKVDISLISVY